MNVPFYDLNRIHELIKDDLKLAFNRVLEKGHFILGEEVYSFEEEFAKYCGAKYCIGVGNGLDALKLSLMAVGIRPGDEVIVPAHTFIATWLAVSELGAIPVPVDIEERTYCIDPALIEKVITNKTKAIIPVHLYGKASDLDRIYDILNKEC